MNRFPLFGVRRADFGPKVPAARIVCARCGATDDVVIGDRSAGEWIDKKFSSAGWKVGPNRDRDFCPGCAGTVSIVEKKDVRPMVKAVAKVPANVVTAPSAEASASVRSEDARKARLDVDLMLVDNFIPGEGRYRDGWGDERIARESGMSVDFVTKRRETEHGALRRDVSVERFEAVLAEIERDAEAKDLDLTKRMQEAEAALIALEKASRSMTGVLTGAVATLRRLSGER